MPRLKGGAGTEGKGREESPSMSQFLPSDFVILWRIQHFTYELPEEHLTLQSTKKKTVGADNGSHGSLMSDLT